MIRHEVHGLQMNTGTPDASGALWYVDKLDGWDSPDLRQSFGDPTGRHGQVLLESQYGSRPLTLGGLCKAQGEAGFWIAYNDLLALANNLVADRVLVVHESVPKRVHYIRGGKPRIDIGQGSSFTWELPLLCRDPLKRALGASTVEIAAGGEAVVELGGSFEAYPTVTAGAGNLVLTRGGSTFRAMGLTGSTEFDMKRRTAYRGTVNEYGKVVSASTWFALQPGTQTVKNTGTSAATLSYTEVWI